MDAFGGFNRNWVFSLSVFCSIYGSSSHPVCCNKSLSVIVNKTFPCEELISRKAPVSQSPAQLSVSPSLFVIATNACESVAT
jgi:hypothetical protein